MSDTLSGRGLLLATSAAICSALGIVGLKSGLAATGVHLIPFALGLAVYGIGIVLGMVLIGRHPVSIAYPIVVGLTLALLAIISAVTLGEALTPLKLGGTALIVIGAGLLVRPEARKDANPVDP